MIDISCEKCSFIFSMHQLGVPQIVRCPKCSECVIVPAVTLDAETEIVRQPFSPKHTWKWRDIIIALLLPVLVYGIMYIQRLSDFLMNPFIGVNFRTF